MSRHMKLLAAVAGVSLLALTIAGKLLAKGPKPKTAMYTIQGKVCSDPSFSGTGSYVCVEPVPVEIGVNVTGWWPPDGTLALQVSEDVLAGLPSGTYYGRARLLDHSFRFEFDTYPGCEFITYDTPLGADLPPGYCRYDLNFWNKDGVGDGSGEFSWYTFADVSTDESADPGPGCSETAPGFCRKRGGPLYPYAVQLLPADEPGGGGPCDLALKGEPCTVGSDCCSGKCTGKQGAKTCK